MKKHYLFIIAFLCLSIYSSAAIDIYIRFIDYENKVLTTDGTFTGTIENLKNNNIPDGSKQFFEVKTVGNDQEQTLNIGAQSTGAGAGKVLFNPLSFSRAVDAASAEFFVRLANGTPFKTVEVYYVKSSGGSSAAGGVFLKETYKLVAIKTIAKAAADCSVDCDNVVENISMEYGGYQIQYFKQNPNGTFDTSTPIRGWNRVKNAEDTGNTPIGTP